VDGSAEQQLKQSGTDRTGLETRVYVAATNQFVCSSTVFAPRAFADDRAAILDMTDSQFLEPEVIHFHSPASPAFSLCCALLPEMARASRRIMFAYQHL